MGSRPVISIGPYDEALLAKARERQKDETWRSDYRTTRPKVERKLAHMMRRRHGGRRARVRGRPRVDRDWKLLAAAVNLARLAVLRVEFNNGTVADGGRGSLGFQHLGILVRRAWSRSQELLAAIWRPPGRGSVMTARIPYSAPATL